MELVWHGHTPWHGKKDNGQLKTRDIEEIYVFHLLSRRLLTLLQALHTKNKAIIMLNSILELYCVSTTVTRCSSWSCQCYLTDDSHLNPSTAKTVFCSFERDSSKQSFISEPNLKGLLWSEMNVLVMYVELKVRVCHLMKVSLLSS